jgi:hypothetical protein
MEEEIIYFYNVKDGKYYQSRYTHRWLNNLQQQCKKQKEVIDKAIKLIKYNERYRNEAEVYQFVDIVSEILNPLQNILEQDETTNNAYLKEFEDWLKEVSE